MLNERLFLSFHHVMYSLRGSFLVRPLIIALTLGSAGALLSALEEAVPVLNTWVPKVLFPSRADPQVAQVILAGIAGSMMTVVSIVFALLMTLTPTSMQFSPRIIVSFARDRVIQRTLGIFLGTFSYCEAAVLGAMLLALSCVAWLLFFIHRSSRSPSSRSAGRLDIHCALSQQGLLDERAEGQDRQVAEGAHDEDRRDREPGKQRRVGGQRPGGDRLARLLGRTGR
jgi:hypothetical protein